MEKLGRETKAEDASGGRGESGGSGSCDGSGGSEMVKRSGKLWEVEIESIRKMLARAVDTGHSN